MESTENLILVPTDYTEVADCAINHALKLASILQGKISLLHVVAKEDEVKPNMEKLQKIADEFVHFKNLLPEMPHLFSGSEYIGKRKPIFRDRS